VLYDGRRDDLKSKLSSNISAVYVEISSYFSFIDDQIYDINDALFIVGMDSISLGVLKLLEIKV
jgi:hypothetical protein